MTFEACRVCEEVVTDELWARLGEAVVAGGDAAPVLQGVDAALDDVALLVDRGITGVGPAAVWSAVAPIVLLVAAFARSTQVSRTHEWARLWLAGLVLANRLVFAHGALPIPTRRNKVSRPHAMPSVVANRAPARPASANPIPASVLRNNGI
jgi:hypothetical protein